MGKTDRKALCALLTAAQRFLAAPTTGNQELLAKATTEAEDHVNPRSGW